ncbi:MAG: TMAO reductase system periplasmic protein TorT, partial [Alphaproteobacteria bacterium]
MKNRLVLTLASSVMALAISGSAFAESWYPYPAQAIEPAFAADGKSVDVSYSPVEKAEKPWNICVSFPHMKDAYWLGVDYGVAEQAKDAGV